jgi:hypothetical protein
MFNNSRICSLFKVHMKHHILSCKKSFKSFKLIKVTQNELIDHNNIKTPCQKLSDNPYLESNHESKKKPKEK